MLDFKKFILWLFVIGLGFLTGCAGTQLVDTWKDPETGPLKFKKTAVLIIDPSQTWRRIGEDEIVRRLPAGSAVPGYRLFPEPEPGDFNQVSGRLRESGFDGAIVVRVLGVEARVNWITGYPALVRPYRTYAFRGPFFYDPGYYRTDQTVRVETSIYALETNRLVWSGVTETFNPSTPSALAAGIAETVIQDLKKQGLPIF